MVEISELGFDHPLLRCLNTVTIHACNGRFPLFFASMELDLGALVKRIRAIFFLEADLALSL